MSTLLKTPKFVDAVGSAAISVWCPASDMRWLTEKEKKLDKKKVKEKPKKGTYLNSKIEHKTTWMHFRQLINKRAPFWVFDHHIQPLGRTLHLSEDCIRLVRDKMSDTFELTLGQLGYANLNGIEFFEDDGFQMFFDHFCDKI